MTGKQLKNSILQLAIQGKLVPQDPHDEPASELLKRIRKEKEQLVKEGKLKKKDLVSEPIADEDKPFEIPESWEWCRLGDVVSFHNGDRGKNYPNKNEYTQNGIAWINTGHITPEGFLSEETMNFISEEKYKSLNAGKIQIGDLVYCLRGATYGKIAHVEPYTKGAVASSLVIVRPILLYVREFLFQYFKAPFSKQQLISYANGAAQPNLAANDVCKFLIPLPPLPEQRRIVAKIEELMPLVEEYDKAQTQLDALNASLPEALKKSILQQAIQGKLVPQIAEDGSAQELLSRLRGERSDKIKKGIIKLSKPEKALKVEITKDFELPSSWTWCVLNDVCRAFGRIGFRGYTKEDLVSSRVQGAIAISPSNMENLRLNLNICTYITEAKYLESPEIMVENGDILLTKTASVGKLALVEDLPWKATINPQIAVLKEISIDRKFLTYVLASPYIQDVIHGFTIGTSIPTFSQEKMLGINIPLPPLPEQHRIVAKIEELFAALK